jgi:hypothetical protein
MLATVTPEASGIGRAPEPTSNAGILVLVVLDSLRYDSWLAAPPRSLEQLGEVQRRWSYASWTAPSHYNLLMGLMPHAPTESFCRYWQR